jgi:hypothetical protein
MNSGVHGKAKAFERLRHEEAIVSYSRTIELDDPTSYALLRIEMSRKLGNTVLALKFSARLFMKILFWIRMDCDYRFYVRQKNYQKASIKLTIDDQNQLYWKRYATINKQLDLFEEAEFGFTVEFGDHELDTWLFWVDILQFLGEFESDTNPLQASEYYPEENEIEYRLGAILYE